MTHEIPFLPDYLLSHSTLMSNAVNTHRVARVIFFLSGFAIAYLSLIIAVYSSFGAGLFANAENGRLAQLVTIAGGIVAQLYLGVAFSRVLCRLWPGSFDNSPRRSGLVLIVISAAIYSLALVLTWKYLTGDSLPGTAIGIQARHIWNVSSVAITSAFVFSAVWMVTVSGTFFRHAMRPVAAESSPFILFLRRFSSTSDRSVAHLVMSATLALRRIVLLVPRLTEPEDWNPVTVFIAGVRVWAPLRSLPYFLQAPDETWTTDVRKLIDKSETVVIDGSDETKSVAIELSLIDELQAWPKTVLMLDRSRKKTWAQLAARTPRAVVYYDCTWKAAIPRLLLGVVLVVPISVPLTLPLILLLQRLDQILEPNGYFVETLAVLILLSLLVVLYKILFLRQVVDRGDRRRLREALAGSGGSDGCMHLRH